MLGMVGWGAMIRNGSWFRSRNPVMWAAARVVSPGGFGLLARTKSHRNRTISSRSSSIQRSSWALLSAIAPHLAERDVGELTARRADQNGATALFHRARVARDHFLLGTAAIRIERARFRLSVPAALPLSCPRRTATRSCDGTISVYCPPEPAMKYAS